MLIYNTKIGFLPIILSFYYNFNAILNTLNRLISDYVSNILQNRIENIQMTIQQLNEMERH